VQRLTAMIGCTAMPFFPVVFRGTVGCILWVSEYAS
jgi:hypothetical protein